MGAGAPIGPGPALPPPAQPPGGALSQLTPEQAQIVQIALGDPQILAAIAEAVTGGGPGAVAGGAIGGASPQGPGASGPPDAGLFG